MTPGQKALREAARVETSRVYGSTVRGRISRSAGMQRADEFLAWLADNPPAEDDGAEDALLAGVPVNEVMETYGLTYGETRALRKKVMNEGAA